MRMLVQQKRFVRMFVQQKYTETKDFVLKEFTAFSKTCRVLGVEVIKVLKKIRILIQSQPSVI